MLHLLPTQDSSHLFHDDIPFLGKLKGLKHLAYDDLTDSPHLLFQPNKWRSNHQLGARFLDGCGCLVKEETLQVPTSQSVAFSTLRFINEHRNFIGISIQKTYGEAWSIFSPTWTHFFVRKTAMLVLHDSPTCPTA